MAMGGPENDFYWLMNGLFIANRSTLTIVNINASQGGNYTCLVGNSAGIDSFSTSLYVAPNIDTPLEDKVLTYNGSSVTLTCDASGFPPPRVIWLDDLDFEISNTSLLELAPVLFGDEGVYRCEASLEIDGMNYTATDATTLFGKHKKVPFTLTFVRSINHISLSLQSLQRTALSCHHKNSYQTLVTIFP